MQNAVLLKFLITSWTLPFRFQKIKNKKNPDDRKERGKNQERPCSTSSMKCLSCRIPTAQKANARKMHIPVRK